MILLIDNYDSFSYNLYQLVGSINQNIQVIRNDELNVQQIERLNPSHIIISPGPGRPKDAGICEAAIDYFKDKIPLLGVCLGHQAIAETFGGKITYAKEIMHGKQSTITITEPSPLFNGLEQKFTAARYHSLAVSRETMPQELKITAQTDDGEIMALEHRTYPIFGLQFHPESILTAQGDTIIRNFLAIGGGNND
ncbi:anthranilate synthase component II [Megamonas hypermegale]|uniref:anthranilate synthase component II n=1 Tax=Megamonas hypermegale TaxID=158847 RepID=UPI0025A38A4F|nr:aminodeoxychorismate/anthranilate synthase component II [Megamonas hypermegale]MDM8142963.1 aminodeoxychorismate/anthranilate synthase component II [Megamonas hypermegale]